MSVERQHIKPFGDGVLKGWDLDPVVSRYSVRINGEITQLPPSVDPYEYFQQNKVCAEHCWCKSDRLENMRWAIQFIRDNCPNTIELNNLDDQRTSSN